MSLWPTIRPPPRKSILVVDDDDGMRAILDALLSPIYQVILATGGVDGYMRANEQPRPDLIIADVAMPDLDGIAMVQRIRENEELRRTRVIFLTAQMSVASLTAGLSVGSFAFLSKPIDAALLERKVKGALARIIHWP
jgi:CheY-like chemotaxis protein